MSQADTKPQWMKVQVSAPVAGMFFITAAIYLIHLYYVRIRIVDVPFWDEWDVFQPVGLSHALNWEWVFAFHNEHRIVFTKLLIWAFYRINDWDILSMVTFNYVIFGGLLVAFGVLLRGMMPKHPAFAIALLIPLLSTAEYENHMWAFQSQMHLYLLFAILGVICLFDEKQNYRRIAGGVVVLWMAMASMTPGLVCAAAAGGVYIPFKLARIRTGAPRKRELAQLAVVLALLVAAVGVWTIGYPTDDRGIHPTSPLDPTYWYFLATMSTLGFGYVSSSPWLGAWCLVLLTLPLVLLPRLNATPQRWRGVAIGAGLLGIMLAISYGRASLGYSCATASRYVNIVAPLGVLTIASVFVALNAHRRLCAGIMAALLVTLALGARNDWNYSEVYRFQATRCQIGLAELTGYYNAVYVLGYTPEAEGPVVPMLYPQPLAHRFERAVELRVSFVRTMEKSTAMHTARVKPPTQAPK